MERSLRRRELFALSAVTALFQSPITDEEVPLQIAQLRLTNNPIRQNIGSRTRCCLLWRASFPQRGVD